MSETPESTKELAARHEAEARFHDEKYGDGDHYPRHYTVNPTFPIYQRMLAQAGDLTDKKVLEFGCGEGWITRDLAAAGAYVSAFDISAEAVKNTRGVLEKMGVADRCDVRVMGAEKLDYPDESFDVLFGFAIIHHLDLSLALPETYRVLKPGGTALFAEPLGTNPLISLYRKMTPGYRTEDEEPLDLDALQPLLAPFSAVTHSDYYVTALASVALAYLPFGPKLYGMTNAPLMRFDDALLRRMPSLGKWAWYTILRLEK